MAVPLTLVTRNIIKENGERNIIREVISEYTVGTKITDLNVNDIGNVVVINAAWRSSNELTSLHVRRLSDILVERLGNSVNLTIYVILTYEAGKNIQKGN